MGIPVELRRDPPASALAWAARHFGPDASVTAVRRLRNAWAAAIHAIDIDDGHGVRHDVVIRRWARTDLPPDVGVVENEAAALTLLESVPELETPRLVAMDPSGDYADVPALVMTRLPGQQVVAPHDFDRFLDGLVAALHAVHAVHVAPARATLGSYTPWGLDEIGDPPPESRRPHVWRQAFEIARRAVPTHDKVLCHRDFHPGNVLWSSGRITGVVDWTHACVGPAAADVAHCRVNLAVLFGLEVADEFARRYGNVDDLAWFDVIDVVGWGTFDAWRWQDAGRTDITDATLVRAADEFLTAAVDRAS